MTDTITNKRKTWQSPAITDLDGGAERAEFSTAGVTDGLGSPNPTS